MKVVVFLGPSLARAEAERLLDVVYRPPAEQGAVYEAATAHAPDAIVLVDGVFGSAPAVRHMEVLFALSRGIRVFGASSLGALRAAELASFGMRGHGLIYRWYRRTPFLDDDEVAVAMAPAALGSVPLSEALVNIRLTLRAAERRGLLDEPARRALELVARATYFAERTYEGLLTAARDMLGPAALARLEEFLRADPVDGKRADARSLLARLAAEGLGPPPKARAFTLTDAFLSDLEISGLDPRPALAASHLSVRDDSLHAPWQDNAS
jgi:hypothetical protein